MDVSQAIHQISVIIYEFCTAKTHYTKRSKPQNSSFGMTPNLQHRICEYTIGYHATFTASFKPKELRIGRLHTNHFFCQSFFWYDMQQYCLDLAMFSVAQESYNYRDILTLCIHFVHFGLRCPYGSSSLGLKTPIIF